MTKRRINLFFILITILFLLLSCKDNAPSVEPVSKRKVIYISGLTYLDTFTAYKHYIPLLNYLEQQLDIDIELSFPVSRRKLQLQLEKGIYDIAFIDSLHYISIQNTVNYRMKLVTTYQGQPFYRTALLKKKDKKYINITELKDPKIAFVNWYHDNNDIYPVLHLFENGLIPGDYNLLPYKTVDKLTEDLKTEKIDAGIINVSAHGSYHNSVTENDFKVLALSKKIVSPLVIFSNRLLDNYPELSHDIISLLADCHKDTISRNIMQYMNENGLEDGYQYPDSHVYDNIKDNIIKYRGINKIVSSDDYYQKARLLLDYGLSNKAIEIYKKALLSDPTNSQAPAARNIIKANQSTDFPAHLKVIKDKNIITIHYDANKSVALKDSKIINIHYGYNNWRKVKDQQGKEMAPGIFSFNIKIDTKYQSLEFVFYNEENLWDNNKGLNWYISLN